MKNKLFSIGIFCLLLISQYSNAQKTDLLWANHLSGTGNSAPIAIVSDASGNTYVVGNFTTQITQSSTTQTFTLNSFGGNDIYIAKYSKNGEIQFLKQIGGSAGEVVTTIALSNDGNYFYVSGVFIGTCNFDATVVSSSPFAATNNDLFLAKYKINGDIQWAYNIAYGTDIQNIANIAVDKNDNIIMCGQFNKDVTFRGGLGTLTSLAYPTIRQTYIAKFDQNGNFLWSNHIEGDHNNTTFRTVRAYDYGYYFSGAFVNNLTFDIETITSNGVLADMFVYKTDLNGTGQWIRKIQGTGTDIVWRNSIDNNGNVFLGGYFNSSTLVVDSTATLPSTVTITNKGLNDIFFSSYAPDGTLRFVKTYGSTANEMAYTAENNDDHVILGGEFGADINFGLGNLVYQGALGEAFMAEFDKNGNILSSQRTTGGGSDLIRTSTIDLNGCNIYVGEFKSPLLAVGRYTFANPNTTYLDAFMAKYGRITLGFAVTNVLCYGATTGAINLTITGDGTAPYTYLWSNGATTEDLTNIAAGTYTITITDANGASKSGSATITQPTAINLLLTATNTNCPTTSDGSINLTVSGGTSPYTYTWSNGATTEDISNLDHGWHYVTVTDANSCIKIDSAQISHPSEMVLTFSGVVPTCTPGFDGSIDLTVINGFSPYTYSWSNGSLTQDLTGLISGTYTVTITDEHGCIKSGSYSISNPSASTLSLISTQPTCAILPDGSIDLIVTGGTAPFVYNWNDGNTNQDRTGIAAGTYSVTVTDASSCSSLGNIVLSPATPPSVSFNPTDPSCAGGDGEVDLIVYSGTTPYTYFWGNAETTQDLTGLDAGTYTVTVTDAKSCTTTGSATIVDHPSIATVSPVGSYTICSGESFLFSANVGTGLTYQWQKDGVDIVGATSSSYSAIAAGNYRVIVTNSYGCSATSITTAIVTVTPSPVVPISAGGPTTFCDPGLVVLSTTNGIGAYQWQFNGANVAVGGVSNTYTANATGSYTVIVTKDGCSTTSSAIVVTENASPTATITTVGSTTICSGSSVQLNANTGAGLSYQWKLNTVNILGATTSSYNATAAGNYTVVVTNTNNCSTTSDITAVVVNALPTVTITPSTATTFCDGGSVLLTASAGTSYQWKLNGSNILVGGTNNTYTADASGSYTVVVSNATCSATSAAVVVTENALPIATITPVASTTICSGSSVQLNANTGAGLSYQWKLNTVDILGATTSSYNATAAGNYTVVVTNTNNCSTTSGITAVVVNALPTASSIATDNSICLGANITINTALTGTGPWLISGTETLNGATTNTFTNTAVAVSPYSQIVTPESGTYIYTITSITDQSTGCVNAGNIGGSGSASVVISSPMSLVLNGTNPSCNVGGDGTINLSVVGGLFPFTYAWSDDNTILSEDRIGLDAGIYTVTVTDLNGCFAIGSYTISNASAPILSITGTNPTCVPGTDGQINLTVYGGSTPYTYAWSDDNTILLEDRTGLPADTFHVTVTDAIGCESIGSIILEAPQAPSLVLNGTSPSCNVGGDGTINLNVIGGLSPFTYLWDDATASTNQNLTGLDAGIYTVTVTGFNGCTAIGSHTISSAVAPILSITGTNPTCTPGADGTINLTVYGGSAPYDYLWDDAAASTTQDITGLVADTFHVTVTDVNNCISLGTYILTNPIAPTIVLNGVNPTCNPGANGTIDLTVIGGVAPFTYLWDNAAASTTQNIAGLVADTFHVTVTDVNGCIANDSLILTAPIAPTLMLAGTNPTCTPGSDGAINLSINGGVAPYTYLWDNAAASTTQDITALVADTFHVTVTDVNGCIANDSLILTAPTAPTLMLTGINPSCTPGSDGSINLTVVGGIAPYTYLWDNAAASTTQDIAGLVADTFHVAVTDAYGCVSNDSLILVSPMPPMLVFETTTPNCPGSSDGSINLTVIGITNPYTYLWDDVAASTSQNLTGLAAGTFHVTVTDVNGCIVNGTVALENPANITLVLVPTNPTATNNDGNIDLFITGGTSPYTYVWNDGIFTEDRPNLSAGNYSVTVTDANGCSKIGTVLLNINGSNPFEFVTLLTNPKCAGSCDGSVIVAPSNATYDYNFLWSNGQTDSTATGLCAGNYYVTVTVGAYNKVLNVTLVNPFPIVLSSSQIDVSCNAGNNGSISVFVQGGTSPYDYNWSNGDSLSTTDTLVAGNYIATITDANGCITVQTYNIVQAEQMEIYAEITNVSCKDKGDASILVSVENGALPYTYLWSNAATTAQISNLAIGNYDITVSDANDCMITGSYKVSASNDDCIDIFSAFTPNSDGNNDVWNIGGISTYPNCTVKIFNEWGNEVFSSKGYTKPWTGDDLPSATYYYVINLGNGSIPYTGPVSIIK